MPATATKVLSLDEVQKRLREGSVILWPNGEEVESGNVVGLLDGQVDVIWLEGYKSRNDTVRLSDVLAVQDGRAREMELGDFKGKGYLTEAGARWVHAHATEHA